MNAVPGLHRRPLPPDLVAFSSPDGRRLFAEALAAGGLEAWFPLSEQLHTQSDPAFCGLGSLVVVLNALAIDPGRTWKGPWRWFGEELLDCCIPHEVVRQEGLTLDQVACLAQCNGARVEVVRPESPEILRRDLAAAGSDGPFLVAAYGRDALGQTGSGHFSPLGGWHPERDLALILDVARFKYPPHWAPVERLWAAMRTVDPASGRPRGYLRVRRGADGRPSRLRATAETFRELRAVDVSDGPLAALLRRVPAGLTLDTADLAAELAATAAAAAVRTTLEAHPDDPGIARWRGSADAATLFVLSWPDDPGLGSGSLAALRDPAGLPARLCGEVTALRSQLAALGDLLAP